MHCSPVKWILYIGYKQRHFPSCTLAFYFGSGRIKRQLINTLGSLSSKCYTSVKKSYLFFWRNTPYGQKYRTTSTLHLQELLWHGSLNPQALLWSQCAAIKASSQLERLCTECLRGHFFSIYLLLILPVWFLKNAYTWSLCSLGITDYTVLVSFRFVLFFFNISLKLSHNVEMLLKNTLDN